MIIKSTTMSQPIISRLFRRRRDRSTEEDFSNRRGQSRRVVEPRAALGICRNPPFGLAIRQCQDAGAENEHEDKSAGTREGVTHDLRRALVQERLAWQGAQS
jgi:hypothetical protein